VYALALTLPGAAAAPNGSALAALDGVVFSLACPGSPAPAGVPLERFELTLDGALHSLAGWGPAGAAAAAFAVTIGDLAAAPTTAALPSPGVALMRRIAAVTTAMMPDTWK
jgi:hypothetical protein